MRKKAIMSKLQIKNGPEGDKLQNIFSLQKQFGKRFCNFDTFNKNNLKEYEKDIINQEKVKWTKEFIICCQDELSEILNWLPWKHWKKYKKEKINNKEVKYEIIDLMHFVISLALLFGMTADEFYSLYVTKMEENNNRQKRGY
jgi:dimeric dUTPase (all-alpha-NTP-PPase superfamily)